jgi:hypothetical protein
VQVADRVHPQVSRVHVAHRRRVRLHAPVLHRLRTTCQRGWRHFTGIRGTNKFPSQKCKVEARRRAEGRRARMQTKVRVRAHWQGGSMRLEEVAWQLSWGMRRGRMGTRWRRGKVVEVVGVGVGRRRLLLLLLLPRLLQTARCLLSLTRGCLGHTSCAE